MNRKAVWLLLIFFALRASFAFAVPLRVGVMAPLTGDFASAGENIRRGIELATADLHRQGVDLTVQFEDACLPATGVAAFKKLVEQDQVQAIVSNYCVVTLAAIRELVERAKIPVLQNSVYPLPLFKDQHYLFSTWPSIDDEVAHTIEVLKAEKKSRLGVLYLITPWGEGYAESVKRQISSIGGTVVSWEATAIGVNDFKSELTRARAAKPDALFIAHTGSMLANLLKQARTAGLDVPVFAPSDADDQEIVKAAGGAAEGLTLFGTDGPSQSDSMKKFEADFLKQFKTTPNPLARQAFDQLQLMAEALKHCEAQPACTAARLRGSGSHEGVSGKFEITDMGGAQREFFQRQVHDGAFQFHN